MKNIIAIGWLSVGMGLYAQTTTMDLVQGDWTCVTIIADMSNIHTDEVYPNDEKYLTPIGNLRIEKDRLYFFDYPCEYHFSAKIENDSSGIWYEHFTRYFKEHTKLELRNDTLIGYGYSVKYFFVRDKLNNATVDVLKKDSINPVCLFNTWYLRTGYDSGYDGLGYVTFVFPFVLPKKMVISRNNISYYKVKGRYIYIAVGGVRRKFYIDELCLKKGTLSLSEMGNWYTRKENVDYNYRISYELVKEEEW